MDKRQLYLSFLFVCFVVFFESVDSFIYDDFEYMDEDEIFPSPFNNRCPFIRNRLKNGRVKIRSRGRVAKFQCDSGYDLIGKRFATCVRGMWNHPIPFCVARGCPRPPFVPNSRVSEEYRGAVVTYECMPGYMVVSKTAQSVLYCDGRKWSSHPPICDAAISNPQMSCDFEQVDLCGWSHDPTHDFDWKRNQYATPSGHVGTGPSFDHTFGPGKGGVYLYMETSAPRKEDDTARIFSPVYTREASGGCFSFFYHMFGESTGALKVYIKPNDQMLEELKPAWEIDGDQGNEWYQEKIDVPRFDFDFQIIIEGVRGNGYLGDTAIDDVSLSTDICSNIPSSNDTSSAVDVTSCRGRCKDPPTNSSCSCLDFCVSDGNCCSDYQLYCSASTAPDDTISETTSPSSVFQSSTESGISSSITQGEYSTTTDEFITKPKPTPTYHAELSTYSLTNVTGNYTSPSYYSSSKPEPAIITSTTTSTQKPTTTTTPVSTTTTTPVPTTTTTTPVPTTTPTTTPGPTTTTPVPTTTTPIPTTTTPIPTTTTTPIPTTTTTTPIPTTTTTTPKPTTTTTTTPIPPTTTTPIPTTTATSTSQKSLPITSTTTYIPETRRTYNLRPRNRTSSTTPMTVPSTRATIIRTAKPPTVKIVATTKSTITTSTQISKFKQTTDDASAFKDARPSREASSGGQSTTTIVCVTLFVIASVSAVSVFFVRKWKAKKLSKMADDSEMRFLSENEVVEFSDEAVMDRHSIRQPII